MTSFQHEYQKFLFDLMFTKHKRILIFLSKIPGKVLVHCQCGISRSTALVAAFLMMRRGMTVQQALGTIR